MVFEPLLIKQEGYYCNVEGDSGGETWEGIARNDYPDWKGWALIDAHKDKLPSNDRKGWQIFSTFLRTLAELQPLVDEFYKTDFWNAFSGDQINNQSIANYIGDWGVNAGLSVPVKHVQEILGISVDGKVGPNTIQAINSPNGQDLFNKLIQARIDFYEAVVKAHPNDQQFLSNWLSRAKAFTYTA